DKTEVTLALIISEELKTKPRGIPLSTLKELIRHRGERLLTNLRDGAIGKLLPREAVPGARTAENSGQTQGAAAPEALALDLSDLRADLSRLNDRLTALEARLRQERE